MGLILVKDFDPLGIVLVIEEMDIFFDQFDRGFIDSAVKGDGSVSVDFASGPDPEEIGEVWRRGSQKMKVLGIAVPRCFFRGPMDGSVIGLITPLIKPFIENAQREGRRKKGEKLHS
jgi:hypothetical protein